MARNTRDFPTILGDQVSLYGSKIFERAYYGNTTNRIPGYLQPKHTYRPGIGAQGPDDPCTVCGKCLVGMENKQLVHANVTINITARKGDPVGYGLDIYHPQEMEYEEEVDYRPAEMERRMPFTQLSALLQRARQDHNLLDQTDVWVNSKGLKVELKEMSARYASNVLAWMRKNARMYHSSWATWEFISKYADQSATDFEELLDDKITDAKAKEWIKEQKLYKALVDISKNSV